MSTETKEKGSNKTEKQRKYTSRHPRLKRFIEGYKVYSGKTKLRAADKSAIAFLITLITPIKREEKN